MRWTPPRATLPPTPGRPKSLCWRAAPTCVRPHLSLPPAGGRAVRCLPAFRPPSQAGQAGRAPGPTTPPLARPLARAGLWQCQPVGGLPSNLWAPGPAAADAAVGGPVRGVCARGGVRPPQGRNRVSGIPSRAAAGGRADGRPDAGVLAVHGGRGGALPGRRPAQRVHSAGACCGGLGAAGAAPRAAGTHVSSTSRRQAVPLRLPPPMPHAHPHLAWHSFLPCSWTAPRSTARIGAGPIRMPPATPRSRSR